MISRILSKQDCADHVRNLLISPTPAFLGRLGGVDTNAAIFTTGYSCSDEKFAVEKRNLEVFTGYYDERDDAERVPEFLRLLTDAYRASPTLSVGHGYLITAYFPELIDFLPVPPDEIVDRCRNWIDDTVASNREITLIPYNFTERLVSGGPSLMSVLSEVLPGKKVLVISPFAQTIKEQYPNRHRFFLDYDYPEFELNLYNAPITYSGLPRSSYPDRNWFETLRRMEADIESISFDVALLCCASYATPLGAFIQNTLGKKAIYFGGVLQLFFGIMGRRFDTPYYNGQINGSVFIRPREAEGYAKQVADWSDKPTEAFGAYF